MTAADVIASVRRHYGAERDGIGPEWATLEEFSLAPGGRHRRADLFCVRAWSGRPKGHERHAIEVKVSRADLLAELKNPGKSEPFRRVSHRFYLAVPAGLLKDSDEIPASWGIYEVTASSCRKRREATRVDLPEPLPETALVEAFRRAARAESRIRGASSVSAADPARLPALAKSLDAARTSEQRAKQARDALRSRLSFLLSEIASAGGWLCRCGLPLNASRKLGYFEVEHADGQLCAFDPERRWSRGEVDWHSLAVRLGVAADAGEATSLDRYPSLAAGRTSVPITLLEAHRVVANAIDAAAALAAQPGDAKGAEISALLGTAFTELEELLADATALLRPSLIGDHDAAS